MVGPKAYRAAVLKERIFVNVGENVLITGLYDVEMITRLNKLLFCNPISKLILVVPCDNI